MAQKINGRKILTSEIDYINFLSLLADSVKETTELNLENERKMDDKEVKGHRKGMDKRGTQNRQEEEKGESRGMKK
jgi:hypothetical protein